MSEGFYPITIQKLTKETADSTTITLQIPAELKDTFNYTAGQYLTFEEVINGEKVRRSYSLCTYEGIDDAPAVTVKRVEGGRMSTYFNENISEGMTLQVMPPMGKFTVIPDVSRSKQYVLFAGGSGITPVLGIAKAVLKDEPNSKVVLVYANRDPESVIFKDLIKKMEQENNGRFQVLLSYDKAPLTWFGLKGVLSEDKIQTIVKSKIGGSFDQYEYFICGPGPMMEVIKNGLRGISVPSERINIEYFTAPTKSEGNSEETITETEEDFTGNSEVTLEVYGKTHTVKCDSNTTILKAAMDEGIDPPYSCTVGVCTTCRAKVSVGKLHMIEREGLSDQEIEQGFVLTCQAQPRSNKIELKYE
ncbi:MAG: 2Fe-2S iron-sulfur cluster-binding protein [Bacteroidia bacterium]